MQKHWKVVINNNFPRYFRKKRKSIENWPKKSFRKDIRWFGDTLYIKLAENFRCILQLLFIISAPS